MDKLEQLLRHVSGLAAQGAPESVIDATLAANGYQRDQFESAIRNRIEAQNFRPDKSIVDRAIGTVREFLAGRTYEMSDNMEAVLRMLSDAPPGLAGMAADFASSGISRDTEGSALLRSQEYENKLGNIQAERSVMQQVLPGQSTAAQVTGALGAGMQEGAAIAKSLPALTPKKGQVVGNAARRVGEALVAAPPAAAAYSMGQYDPRLDKDPTQSLGGDPMNTVQRNMMADTLVSSVASPIAGPMIEGVNRAASKLDFVNPERVGEMSQQMMTAPDAKGGETYAGVDDMLRPPNPYAAQPSASGAGGGQSPPPPPNISKRNFFPPKQEYDPYYNGLIKLGNAISSDQMTVDQVRTEAIRQDQALPDGRGQLIDSGGINLQRMGKALYNAPGSGAEVAQRELEARQLDQGQNMQRMMEGQLTAGKDPEIFARESAERRRTQINPQYEKLMGVGLPENLNPELRQLLDVDPRIRKIYEQKRIEERDLRGNPDPGEFEGDMTLGKVEVARKAISDREGKLLKANKRDSAQALGEYRRRLMAAADEATMQGPPEDRTSAYGNVRREGYDERRLVEVSKQAQKDFYKARPEVMREDFNKLTPAEKDAYRAGFVREFVAYIDPRISDSANKANIARAVDRRALKDRIEILFDSPEQFKNYWESVLVEAQRSKTYISTIGDATRNTGPMQQMAADNLIDPSPLEDIASGFSPMQRIKDLGNVLQTRELEKVSSAIGPKFFAPGLDNIKGLLDDVQLAQEMNQYYNRMRAQNTGAIRSTFRGLLE